jgi:HK97 family phage portal protein
VARTLLGALTNAARTATTTHTPVPFASRAQSYGIFGSNRSAEGQMRAMSAVGTLFAIVDRTSNATALVDWKLWRKAKSGRDEDRVEVTSHAALDLWNRPNPFMPRQEFVESSTQHYDLTGETEWVIARHPGVNIPLEMWPVRPDRMTPQPDPETFLRGWVYTSPDGQQVPLELDEVIQLRRPNPLDPYRGLSPVLSILPDLDTSRYAAEWSRAFFINSAQPGGIIEVPQPLSDPDFDQLRDRWAEQHKGVGNAHKVAILEHGKWVDRTISQRDMQFVELRGATADRVREAYGISKTAIGDFEDINRASLWRRRRGSRSSRPSPPGAHQGRTEPRTPPDVRRHRGGPGVRLLRPGASGPGDRGGAADGPLQRGLCAGDGWLRPGRDPVRGRPARDPVPRYACPRAAVRAGRVMG